MFFGLGLKKLQKATCESFASVCWTCVHTLNLTVGGFDNYGTAGDSLAMSISCYSEKNIWF